MWETLTFNGIEAVVTGMKLYTDKGELVYCYELSRRDSILREREKNPRIFGMSIPATVMERSGNRVRVWFDIDSEYEASEQTKYFTYAIESSSFYCMPEEGSQVHIYFPDHDEQSAIAVHALRTGMGTAGTCTNPDNKRFSDPSGSAMDMTPGMLQFAPDASGATVLTDGDDIREGQAGKGAVDLWGRENDHADRRGWRRQYYNGVWNRY